MPLKELSKASLKLIFICKFARLSNFVVITLLENYDYFVHTLDTIGNQWEIFVYRFYLPAASLFYNDICEKFMISMDFGDWIHLITHCSMIWWFIVHLGIVLDWYQNISKVFKLIKNVLWTTLGRRSIPDVLCFSVS